MPAKLVTLQKLCMTSFKLNMDKKNAQISECDFGKPQTWETSRHLRNLKFLRVVCE